MILGVMLINFIMMVIFASLSCRIMEIYYENYEECLLYYKNKPEMQITDVELGFLCWPEL
jgi:hypothetical protein